MSRTSPLRGGRHRRARAATALAAAGALITAAGVIGLVAAPASADHKDSHNPSEKSNGKKGDNGNNGNGGNSGNPGNGGNGGKPAEPPGQTNHKSYVCKYVSTPGEGERLQTGRNPIWVDNHSLLGHHGPTFVGQEFSDKHGRSVVIVANTPKLNPEPSVASCPTPQRNTRTPAGINVSDPCGPNNVSWSAKPDDYFNYSVSGSSIIATLKPQFSGDTVTGTTSWPVPVDSNTPCPGGGGQLTDLTPGVSFTDADCDSLGSEDWDGTLEAFVDYSETGDVGPGETVTVTASIEPGHAGTHQFASGAQTVFTHTFDDVTLADCVAGEETVIPKPKPTKKPKPDAKPTVKGVQTVAPPAAAPTAVAAGIGDPTASPLQTVAQMLVAGGMLLLVAGAWIGLGRRETGTHEA